MDQSACAALIRPSGRGERICARRAAGVFRLQQEGGPPADLPLCGFHGARWPRVGDAEPYAGAEPVPIEDAWKYRRRTA